MSHTLTHSHTHVQVRALANMSAVTCRSAFGELEYKRLLVQALVLAKPRPAYAGSNRQRRESWPWESRQGGGTIDRPLARREQLPTTSRHMAVAEGRFHSVSENDQARDTNTDQLGTRVGDLPLATPPSPLPASEPQECSAVQLVAEQRLRPVLALSLHPSTPLPSTAPRHRALLSV